MLINRRLHDAGTVQLPTGTAHRLVGVVSRKPILRRLTYLIDEDTYRPIRVTFQMWFVGGPRAQRTVVRYDVLRYERLVESAATSRLLRIETTARTRKLFLNGDPHTIAEKKRMSERVTRFYRDCGTRP
jgi:hypothetical protein